jgi:hypothetical protein
VTRPRGRSILNSVLACCGPAATERIVVTGTSLLTYWYFHLPNFILAALMYTLLGRALLGLIVQPDSGNYIWRFFCRITEPVVAVVALATPKAAAPVVIWLLGVVWLFWLRVALLYVFLLLGAVPKVS